MKVSELMTRDVASCRMNHTLVCPALIMWDRDCGCVPIVDADDRPIAMITDRDICMGTLAYGRSLDDIFVEAVATASVVTVPMGASIEAAETLMQQNQIRRIPVVDGSGRLKGIISMNDIARHVEKTIGCPHGLCGDLIAQTLAAIGKPHPRPHDAETL